MWPWGLHMSNCQQKKLPIACVHCVWQVYRLLICVPVHHASAARQASPLVMNHALQDGSMRRPQSVSSFFWGG
jgi:hypothetical protein